MQNQDPVAFWKPIIDAMHKEPDATFWTFLSNPTLIAVVGTLAGSLLTAWLTHRWTAGREERSLRYRHSTEVLKLYAIYAAGTMEVLQGAFDLAAEGMRSFGKTGEPDDVFFRYKERYAQLLAKHNQSVYELLAHESDAAMQKHIEALEKKLSFFMNSENFQGPQAWSQKVYAVLGEVDKELVPLLEKARSCHLSDVS